MNEDIVTVEGNIEQEEGERYCPCTGSGFCAHPGFCHCGPATREAVWKRTAEADLPVDFGPILYE